MMRQAKYEDVRSDMLPGDVIAFSGGGKVSDMIKWATKSPVSHVGTIIQRRGMAPGSAWYNEIIESTAIAGGKLGVQINLLSGRLEEYAPGAVWWLPLHDAVRSGMDFDKWHDFMMRQRGKAYDFEQAAKSGVDWADNIPFLSRYTLAKEDFGKMFCSELVAAGLEHAGGTESLNASECTPADLVKWRHLYREVVQIQGEPLAIG